VAIAADNAARLISNFRSQRDIARRMTTIARRQQEQLAEVYWPREEQFLAEFSQPEPIEPIETMGRRYAGRLMAPVAARFAEEIRRTKCAASRYCASAADKTIQDLMMARSAALANARVMGRNMAFAEYQARTDINYARRMQAVSWGRGLTRQAASLYGSAGEALARAGASIGGTLSGALEDFGYANTQGRLAGARLSSINNQPPGVYAPAPDFGLASSQQSFNSTDASRTIEYPETQLSERNDFSTNQGLQKEGWNEANVGNRDLARTGSVLFPVTTILGVGYVQVNMDSFPLMHVDHKNEGQF